MSSTDNFIKKLHGLEADEALAKTVDALEDLGAIEVRRVKPVYGYEGLKDDQFKASYEIESPDGNRSLLYSTSSVRSDRLKGVQWNAQNIMQIDSGITDAFVVVPNEDALSGGKRTVDDIRNRKVHSAVSDVLTIDEFYLWEKRRCEDLLSKGALTDKEGKRFEVEFGDVMASPKNLEKFNGENRIGFRYDLFEKVMKTVGVAPKTVDKVEATTEIPKLPSGGNPKTDVAVTVHFLTGGTKRFTFSLKNSSDKKVSVHQYPAKKFAEVLNPEDAELAEALEAFQAAGSENRMDEASRKALWSIMPKYREKLDRWVLGGYGDEDSTPIQRADFLVTRDKATAEVSVRSIDVVCAELEENNSGRYGFSTVFSWTYSSGARGKSIQLKMPTKF